MDQENEASEQDIAALVKADEEKRRNAFVAELDTLMKKHRCSILPVVTLVGEKIEAGLRVVATKA